MEQQGFRIKHVWSPKIKNSRSIPGHDHYITKVYEYPKEYQEKSLREKENILMNTRLTLRDMGEADSSIFVFSFYPDIITLKAVGDPMELASFFCLDKDHV